MFGVFLSRYYCSGYRRLNTISNNELTEMAINVRILLKKFHFASNFKRSSG